MAVTLPPCGEIFERRYRLESVLGEGGFACVYRATDIELGRAVAIKILKPLRGTYDEVSAERFMREVRVVARLSDPHIVTVLDYGRTPQGLLYTVFELVGGKDLGQILKESGTLDEASTVRILLQVLRALAVAHDSGLLHRDIKPDNIRVYEYMGDPLRVKLLDFGIARSADQDASLTETGKAVGTPRFMAPEQLYGQPLGPYTDLYALGLVAFEMLVGRPADHIRSLVHKERVALPEDVPVSAPLRRTIDRLLERESAARYQSAADVIARLEEFTRSSLSAEKTHLAVPLLKAAAAPAAPSPPPAPPPPAAPPERAPRRALLLVAVASVTLLFVGLLLYLNRTPAVVAPQEGTRLPSALVRAGEPGAGPASGIVVTPIPVDAGAHETDTGVGGDAGVAGSPPACKAAPVALGTQPMHWRQGLREVQWVVHVPRDYAPSRPHPAVVLFHDDASSPLNVLESTSLAQKADEAGFIVIAPRDEALGYVWHDERAVQDAVVAVQQTQEALCIDPERIYLVGYGSGMTGADRVSCEPWVSGIAIVSQVPEQPRWGCEPIRPVPLLLVLPTATTFLPVQGGVDCLGNPKVSFDDYEAMWRRRNDCSTRQSTFSTHPEGRCRAFDCREGELVSCRIDAGRSWAGAPPRKIDLLGCDGPPTNFPHNDVIWQFFASLKPAAPSER